MALGAGFLALADCTGANLAGRAGPDHGVARARLGERVAKGSAVHRPNKPDTADAHRPVLHDASHYSAVGLASWYGADFHGRRTANGETFDMNSFTAAHRTLPIPCNVRVTNLANHRSIVVRINDRGPFTGRRLIDVSAETAKALGFYGHGLAKVKVDYVGRADGDEGRGQVTGSAASP